MNRGNNITKSVADRGEMERLIYTYHGGPPPRDRLSPEQRAKRSITKFRNKINYSR
jgi:hypothetical protein